jgi:8-oxo-dGTP pyrophosphatase MutT (NUDIX family)
MNVDVRNADVMNDEASSTIGRSPGQTPSLKFLRLAELRKLRRCEQVAAVCFRVRSGLVEFLLVQTGKGRWIFPKGGAEPGLTHAQAAALEAFEEAGVHGRMEEASFTSYVQRKRRKMRRPTDLAVSAHLCEVLRLVTPQELNRNPTWFSAEKAKQRLREDRSPDHGADLARVVDRAVTRVRRLRTEISVAPEAQARTTQAAARAKAGRHGARLFSIDGGGSDTRGTTSKISGNKIAGKAKGASAG